MGTCSRWTLQKQEIIVEDALDANQNKDGILGGTSKYIEIWESGCLKNETYCEKMEDYVAYWKDVVEELDSSLLLTPHKL